MGFRSGAYQVEGGALPGPRRVRLCAKLVGTVAIFKPGKQRGSLRAGHPAERVGPGARWWSIHGNSTAWRSASRLVIAEWHHGWSW